MARLGRGRREGAKLIRAPFASQPTRRRIIVEMSRSQALLAHLGRARRETAKIIRPPAAAPIVPVVRNRVIVKLDAAAERLGHLGRARRAGGKLVRPTRATPTATPLVRNRVIVETDARATRFARLGRARRVSAKILKPRLASLRPAKPIVEQSRTSRTVCAHRPRRVRLLRAPYQPQRIRQPIVQRRRSRGHRARRAHPVILASRVFVIPAGAAPPITTRTRAATATSRTQVATVPSRTRTSPGSGLTTTNLEG